MIYLPADGRPPKEIEACPDVRLGDTLTPTKQIALR
jgi:hypothetical protein